MKVFQIRALTILILFFSLLGSGIFVPNSSAQDAQIPDWIKDVAGWWASGVISETEFLTGIEYLVNNNIILINFVPCNDEIQSQYGDTKSVPSWIKNNANWWSENLIDDTDFINGLQYLIEYKIIKIDNKKMKSKGTKQGFECVKCSNRSVSKSILEIPREIQCKLYLPSISAHRHLTRP